MTPKTSTKPSAPPTPPPGPPTTPTPPKTPSGSDGGGFAAGHIAAGIIGALVGALILLLLVSAVSGVGPIDLLRGQIRAGGGQQVTIQSQPRKLDAVVAVVKKVGPSVVPIKTAEVLTDRFHQSQQVTGEGSGVIYKSDGYIITNEHVVEGASQITVTIGTDDVPATVVASDKENDIAVIKVARTGLPAADLGTSKDLSVGELVVALGSPFGLEHTVTSGVVSGLHRNFTTEDQPPQTYTNLIQTDAAINPGNSGGALAGSDGKVVGINTLIISPSGANAGIGFAIPIETAKAVADQLVAEGKVSHPYIGVTGQTVDRDLAKQLDLSVETGAIIVEVVNGSPADKAGLKKGDVIVKFDGEMVKSIDDLIGAIRAGNVGDRVTLEYVRGKDHHNATLTLAEKPKS